MSFKSFSQSSLALVVYFLVSFFASVQSIAAPNISPAQLAALKALSPAEQKALAQQYGVDLGDASLQQPQEESAQQLVTVLPRSDLAMSKEESDELSQPALEKETLKPFGYDLFAGEPTTFEPISDVPVSENYMLGSGDSLKVQLYGKQSSEFELVVNSKGQVAFPDLGPLTLGGLEFSDAKSLIVKTVSRRMIGVKANVSMGALRSIRVFVLGDAYKPGSYVVSSLSTITNALVLSGGVSQTGSLRNIELKRKGKKIKTLDLYDLLLAGDNSADVGLRSGDVVFIPPVGARVEVDGQVRRPAIYELQAQETLKDAIRYAGGLTETAFGLDVRVSRINDLREKVVSKFDYKKDGATVLYSGDRVFVPEVLDKLVQSVALKGHVHRPGDFELRKGLRVSSLLRDVRQLKAGADLRFGLIKRHDRVTGRLSLLSFNLAEIWQGDEASDHVLVSDDELFVFDLLDKQKTLLKHSTSSDSTKTAVTVKSRKLAGLGSDQLTSPTAVSDSLAQNDADRNVVIADVILELRYQSEVDNPSLEVEVTGSVRFPGVYPLIEGMTANQLIHAAGGLTQQAYSLVAEVNRTSFDHLRQRRQSRLELNLDTSEGLSFLLKSHDVLQVRATPEWRENAFISLAGEVRFPGRYPIQKGDTLQSVLKRAGGVTEYAYIPGAIFTRQSLQEQEQQRLDDMKRRLSEDIAKAQLAKKDEVGVADGVGVAQQLLDQLNSAPALGRLVIDLSQIVSKQTDYSLVLEDGDRLSIPPKRNSVSVIGEVQLPTSQIYQPSMTYNEYIESSGGTTDSADDDRIYIIKANGSVVLPETSSWFSSANSEVSPGDTIVVPLDADKLDQVVLWRDLSQIFYQVALGAAAVGSL